MSDLSNAKIFGGIGAILSLVGGFIPTAGFIITIVGIVLVAIGVKKIADTVNRPNIFKNYLIYIVMSIIALISIPIILFITFGAVGFSVTNMLDPSGAGFTDPSAGWDIVGMLIGGCLVALIVAFIFYVISAVYYRKSYKEIAETTRTDIFGTTGTIYLVGAILVIVFGIGILIMFIARILEIVSFFSLPDQLQPMPQQGGYGYGQPPQQQYGAPPQQPYSPPPPQQQQYTPPPPPQQPPPQQQTGRFCPGCGRPIPMDAQVCPYCGKDFR